MNDLDNYLRTNIDEIKSAASELTEEGEKDWREPGDLFLSQLG